VKAIPRRTVNEEDAGRAADTATGFAADTTAAGRAADTATGRATDTMATGRAADTAAAGRAADTAAAGRAAVFFFINEAPASRAARMEEAAAAAAFDGDPGAAERWRARAAAQRAVAARLPGGGRPNVQWKVRGRGLERAPS